MGTGRQVNLFIAIGVAMVFVDLATYRSLMWGGLGIDLAKGIGYCVGTVCAYFLNRRFTFRAKGGPKSFVAYVMLYVVTLGLNVAANAGVLRVLPFDGEIALAIAYVFATGLAAATIFLGLKYVVFRAPRTG